MEEFKTRNGTGVKFENLAEMYAYAAGAGTCPELGQASRREPAGRRGGMPWEGTHTFEEATSLASTGWAEPRSQVTEQVGNIAAELRAVLPTAFGTRWDVCGGSVDVDRFLAGDPENMLEGRLVPSLAHGQVVRVLLNVGALGAVSTETMIRRGIAMLALVELVRMAGLSLELWIETTTSKGGATYTVLTRALGAGDSIDVDALMFPLAHPAQHRRITFACRERASAAVIKRFGFSEQGGYGSSHQVVCDAMVDPDITIAEPLSGETAYTRDPAKWIRERLVELGVLVD